METNKFAKRAAAVAYLNKCFDMGVTWINARNAALLRFHVTLTSVERWRNLSKYKKDENEKK